MRRVIAVLALLAALPVQGQQVYRWVDAQGEVHYSGTPPPGQQATPETLKVPKGSSAPVADGTPQGEQAEPSEYEKKKAEYEKAVAANEARIAAERARNCATAREIITRLTDAPARRYQQPDGTYTQYDDASREARIADARAAEAENCD